MDLRELLRKHLIKEVKPDKRSADELLRLAEKDISAAEDNLKTGHPDWALAIAYNAMLCAGRALMLSKGYGTNSESHHFAVVEFCASAMPSDASALVSAFNRYRIRRHDVIYGEAESVGEDEAKRAIANACAFVSRIKKMIG
ncbi:MAG: HEPN domain-containing protein [Candidatus Micrarchaeota archaeon]